MNLCPGHTSLTRSLGAVAAAVLFASLVCAQTGPAGHWEGVFTIGGREVGLSLDLARNEKTEWIASMGAPAQNVTGLVVTDVAVNGKSVKFVAVSLRMAAFDLALDPDGKLKGTFSTPQGALPVEFKRTGEAKVELIPTSPAVSKDLEGDWEGSIELADRTVRIGVHLKNRPDKTVEATFSPDASATRLPLNDVKQTGRTVEFGLKIAHAGFQGTLNEAGTELAGQWTHETDTVSITLRKK